MHKLQSKFLVPALLFIVAIGAYFLMPSEPEVSSMGGSEPPTTMPEPIIVEAAPDEEFSTVQLYFATNRRLSADSEITASDPASQFSNARGTLRYGTASVSIPREHTMGNLESQNWLVAKFFNPDPEKHVILQEANIWDRERMLSDLNDQLTNRDDKALLLFVHGYNTSFDKAARRTSQVVYDLAFHGPAMFFSWPSQARTSAYTVDSQNAQWAVPDMEQVLLELTTRDADRIIVIAHSMGTRILSRGLDALIANNPAAAAKISTVVLAAPDIDAEIFKRQLLLNFKKLTNPATVYASDGDTALLASQTLNGEVRLGDTSAGISAMDGIEFIDASGFKSDFFRHTYFGDNASILSDIFHIVCTQERAKDRQLLAALEIEDTNVTPVQKVTYWKMQPTPANQPNVKLDACAQ